MPGQTPPSRPSISRETGPSNSRRLATRSVLMVRSAWTLVEGTTRRATDIHRCVPRGTEDSGSPQRVFRRAYRLCTLAATRFATMAARSRVGTASTRGLNVAAAAGRRGSVRRCGTAWRFRGVGRGGDASNDQLSRVAMAIAPTTASAAISIGTWLIGALSPAASGTIRRDARSATMRTPQLRSPSMLRSPPPRDCSTAHAGISAFASPGSG